MHRLQGYLAAETGFSAAEIEGMTEAQVRYWVSAVSAHYRWVKDQE